MSCFITSSNLGIQTWPVPRNEAPYFHCNEEISSAILLDDGWPRS